MAENQIVYSFILYGAFLLLPLVPAIVIYILFPNTQVSAEGPLSGLNIKTTGAFSAYVVTAVLGYFLIQNIQGTIANSFYQTWEINARLKFVDSSGVQLPNSARLVDLTTINIHPFIKNKDASFIKFIATGKGKDIIINFSLDESFESQSFSIADLEASKVDEVKRQIQLGEVTLRQLKTYHPTGSLKASGDGPPISPSN